MSPTIRAFGSDQDAKIYLSVVIRARNEAESLKHVFEALRAQRCSFSWEIIVVDNESEDDTRQLCEQYGARVVAIGRGEFTYGRALNVGIAQARGELILTLSAHAVPIGSCFFESAVEPFADPSMAAARCLSTSDRSQLKGWYKPQDIHYQSVEDQHAAEMSTRWTRDYPAATCCVLRKSVWEQTRFDEQLEAVEDKLWASQVLSQGYKIRRCTEAVYYYTRELKGKRLWKKLNSQLLALYRINGYVPLSWKGFLLRVLKAIASAPIVAIKHIIKSFIKNFYLVIIPWQARYAPKIGSLADFDQALMITTDDNKDLASSSSQQ